MKVYKNGVTRSANSLSIDRLLSLGYEMVEEEKELSREEIYDYLEKLGIEFDKRSSTKKLLELMG